VNTLERVTSKRNSSQHSDKTTQLYFHWY